MVSSVTIHTAAPNPMSKTATAWTGVRESLLSAHIPIPSNAEAGRPIMIITCAASLMSIALPPSLVSRSG